MDMACLKLKNSNEPGYDFYIILYFSPSLPCVDHWFATSYLSGPHITNHFMHLKIWVHRTVPKPLRLSREHTMSIEASRSYDNPSHLIIGGWKNIFYDLTMDPLSQYRRLENLYFRPHDPTDFVMSGPFGFPFPILRCTSFKPVSGRRRHKRKSLRSYAKLHFVTSGASKLNPAMLRQTQDRNIGDTCIYLVRSYDKRLS